MKEKNPALLLDALASARLRRPDLALVIAGDGQLRNHLEKRVGDLNIARHVIWLGNVPISDLRGWYANATATVLPSLQEGFGKVIVESYLMGTPGRHDSFCQRAGADPGRGDGLHSRLFHRSH